MGLPQIFTTCDSPGANILTGFTEIRNLSRRSLAYHQFRRNCISSVRRTVYHQAAENTRLRVMRYKSGKPLLMIYTPFGVMIYQACGLDKKSAEPKGSTDFWSEWRDLNSRPLDPQSSALPTALHPDSREYNTINNVILQVFFKIFSVFFNFLLFCRDFVPFCALAVWYVFVCAADNRKKSGLVFDYD